MKPRAYFEPIVRALCALKTQFVFFEITGSYRRGTPMMSDVDVVCLIESEAHKLALDNWIQNHGKILRQGPDFLTIEVDFSYSNFLQGAVECKATVDFKIHYNFDEWPSALLHFTGSKEHNIAMRCRAKAYGFKLNEYGLWLAGIEERVMAPSEAEIYSCLGMEYVPPEKR